jgi:hypothetical protein
MKELPVLAVFISLYHIVITPRSVMEDGYLFLFMLENDPDSASKYISKLTAQHRVAEMAGDEAPFDELPFG